MYKEGDRCDERITRAASIVSGCTWPLIFPNSPFSSFSSLFRDAGAGSGQWHRLVQHVPFLPSCVPIALHISSRFPPSPFSSSSTWLLLLSCPARLSTRVAIGEEKETTHRAWQIGNEEIVDGWMDGKDGRSLNGEEKDLGIWKGKRFSRVERTVAFLQISNLTRNWRNLRKFLRWKIGYCTERKYSRKREEEENWYLLDDKEMIGRKEDRFDGMGRWIAPVPFQSSFSIISPLLTETTRRKWCPSHNKPTDARPILFSLELTRYVQRVVT